MQTYRVLGYYCIPMSTINSSRTKQNLEIEYKLLLLLSRMNLSDTEREEAKDLIPQIQHWKLFTQRCIGAYVAPLVHADLAVVGVSIPETVETALANSYNQVLVRNIRLYRSFTTVLSEFNAAKIDCIPLKGIYLAEAVYKDLGLRHLSDIDLLVRTKDAATVCELMRENDWDVKEAEPRSEFEKKQFFPAHPFTFLKNGVTIELHTHLYNRNQRATISGEELWKNTHTEEFCDGTIRQFSSGMLLQHLCLHLYKHLVGAECKLVSFCDIRELILQRNQDLNWAEFKNLCEKFNCLDEVVPILFLCRNYWHTDIPESFFSDEEAEKKMEEKFLQFLTGQASELSVEVENIVGQSLTTLHSIDGFSGKMSYALGYVFPRPVFMYRHFQLKERTWLLPWYVIRVFNLTGKLLVAAFSSFKRLFG